MGAIFIQTTTVSLCQKANLWELVLRYADLWVSACMEERQKKKKRRRRRRKKRKRKVLGSKHASLTTRALTSRTHIRGRHRST